MVAGGRRSRLQTTQATRHYGDKRRLIFARTAHTHAPTTRASSRRVSETRRVLPRPPSTKLWTSLAPVLSDTAHPPVQMLLYQTRMSNNPRIILKLKCMQRRGHPHLLPRPPQGAYPNPYTYTRTRQLTAKSPKLRCSNTAAQACRWKSWASCSANSWTSTQSR